MKYATMIVLAMAAFATAQLIDPAIMGIECKEHYDCRLMECPDVFQVPRCTKVPGRASRMCECTMRNPARAQNPRGTPMRTPNELKDVSLCCVLKLERDIEADNCVYRAQTNLKFSCRPDYNLTGNHRKSKTEHHDCRKEGPARWDNEKKEYCCENMNIGCGTFQKKKLTYFADIESARLHTLSPFHGTTNRNAY